MDSIAISQLELQARLGVTESERAQSQRITISLLLEPDLAFAEINDDIRNTLDYAKVCDRVKMITDTRARNLIETLAEDITAELLRAFPLRSIEIELRKFALAETNFVAVRIRRDAQK